MDRERTLDGLEEVSSCFEASVGSVIAFRGKAHGGTIGAAGLGVFIVAAGLSANLALQKRRRKQYYARSTAVPGQANNHRTIAPIIIIFLLLQSFGNGIVHFLIGIFVGRECSTGCARGRFLDLFSFSGLTRISTLREVVSASAASEGQSSEQQSCAGVAFIPART